MTEDEGFTFSTLKILYISKINYILLKYTLILVSYSTVDNSGLTKRKRLGVLKPGLPKTKE